MNERLCKTEHDQKAPCIGIDEIVQAHRAEVQEGQYAHGEVAEQALAAGDGLPELAREALRGAVPLPHAGEAKLAVEAGAARPDVGQTPAVAGPERDAEDVGDAGGDVHILGELVGVAVVLDTVVDSGVGRCDDSVVPFVVYAELVGDAAQEVGREEHGLHFGKGRNGAESRANESNEPNGGIVVLPDITHVGLTRARIGSSSGVLGSV